MRVQDWIAKAVSPLVLLLVVAACSAQDSKLKSVFGQVKQEQKTTGTIALDVKKYDAFTYTDPAYKGPVSWFATGGAIAYLEVATPTVIAGEIQGVNSAPLAGKIQTYSAPAGSLLIQGIAPGSAKIYALGIIDGKAVPLQEYVIVVGGVIDDDPVKPDIKPKPKDKSPIAADGLHVLVVYPDNAPVPQAQFNVIYGQKTRKLLNELCASPDAYRIWKDNEVVSEEKKIWQDAYKLPRQSLPWVIVSNPSKGGGYEGPLPGEAEFENLLRKFGGK